MSKAKRNIEKPLKIMRIILWIILIHIAIALVLALLIGVPVSMIFALGITREIFPREILSSSFLFTLIYWPLNIIISMIIWAFFWAILLGIYELLKKLINPDFITKIVALVESDFSTK